jgi:hypothetical protein
MFDITVIFTRHKRTGICNSLELHRIIELIEPEVIFEELSYAQFNQSYEEKSLITVETDAIKEYLKNHKIEHIPVDTYPLPNMYHEEVDLMLNKIFQSNIYESLVLRKLLVDWEELISQKGFPFLNSDENDKYLMEINFIKEKILHILNHENLFRIHILDKEIISKREYQIIKNIYNFSIEKSYNTGLMFIGAGHRKTIVEMIKKLEPQESIKLNWSFPSP